MLEIKNITKIYEIGDIKVRALDGVSLKFNKGEFVAVLGPSGCGKTTLLNVVGGLDRYNSGDLIINNKSTRDFKDSDWDAYRNNSVGFVFQSYNLINHISILENVEMGMTLSGVSPKIRREKAIEVLTKVGVADQMYKRSSQLSGGQKQRVAIARALVNDPDVILADEPTGALDSKTSVEVMELIAEIAKEKLVIMVTHNTNIAKKYATRIVRLKDGLVVESNDEDIIMDKDDEYELVKTSMSLMTALNLSFKNLKTKLGRTLITAFAGSIGIIGVALVLAMSNGFNEEISKLETETLSTLPITISEIPISFVGGPGMAFETPDAVYTDEFEPVSESDLIEHFNIITDEYIDYLYNINDDFISSIQLSYGVQMLVISDVDGELLTSANEEVFFKELSNNDSYIEGQFDLVSGALPANEYEVVLIVDIANQIDNKILEFLGIDTSVTVNFDDVIGKELVVANSNDIEFEPLGAEVIQHVTQDSYNNGIQLTVVGVMRAREDGLESTTSGIYYHDDLELIFIDANSNSDICIILNSLDNSEFSEEQVTALNLQKHAAGCLDTPVIIGVYPTSFDYKDEVLDYLDAYNEGLAEEDQLVYTDLAATISGIMGSIIKNISTVLVAFAAISLVVSSIMIGIITYVSVLERTKEIGILRSLGARKRDISRVFNAESFIVGLVAGTMGVGLSLLLSIPINIILGRLLEDLDNVAQLRLDHALYLILISVVLTFVAGLIPSKIAANKDPVEALRHNE
ncbi:MAG: ATP-binding cassette domain-containing protein [Candidatus Izemoplasma sp.]